MMDNWKDLAIQALVLCLLSLLFVGTPAYMIWMMTM